MDLPNIGLDNAKKKQKILEAMSPLYIDEEKCLKLINQACSLKRIYPMAILVYLLLSYQSQIQSYRLKKSINDQNL